MKRLIIYMISFCLSIWSINAQDLVNAEYFFDSDPGIGNGTSISAFSANDTVNLNLNIPTTGLAPGFHRLYIRFQDVASKWGIYEGGSFYIQTGNTVSNAPLISHAEYFFDSDPGIGNGTPISSFSPNDTVNLNLNISTAGLNPGFHRLYIRFQDSDSKWGIYEGASFYAQDGSGSSTSPDLTFAEYFFDNDPGVGNGTALPGFTAADTVDLSFNANFAALSVGQHSVYVRFRDANGKWGIYEGQEFTILNCNAPATDFSFSSLSVCQGDSIFLSDNSSGALAGATYEWDINNDGSIESTTSTIAFVVITNQSFDIKYVVSNGACRDSVIRTFNVDTVNTAVSQNGITLTADQSGANYQWLDCNNNFQPIANANNQQFTAAADGNYAVELSNGSCIDTSACFNVIVSGLNESKPDQAFVIYPNPTINGSINIDLGYQEPSTRIRILDLRGRLLFDKRFSAKQLIELEMGDLKGVYLLEIIAGDNKVIEKVVLN